MAESNEKKRFDYRHIIAIAITLGFVAVAVFVFPSAFGRIVESGRDFGLSVAYYFCELCDIEHSITPTVNNYPDIIIPNVPVPETWEKFQAKWAEYWELWATKENVNAYLDTVGNTLWVLTKVTVIVLPFVLLFVFILGRYLQTPNNDYDKDTKPLRAFKRVMQYTYRPVKDWLVGFYHFLQEHSYYKKLWLCIWAYAFNFFTILIEFFAYYFYFVVSFDVVNIYRQVYKLSIDLYGMFEFVPAWAWVIIGYIVFDKIRKATAYGILNHLERRNRGFINARPIALMTVGTMGKKKTTAITDMALSQDVMFRDVAFQKLLENDLKFPNFPWVNLEMQLKQAIAFHQVYNLSTTRRFTYKKFLRWQKQPCRDKLFGYDYERYGLTYDDKLKVANIWEVVETYSQLYFIYVVQSSLLVANYSIRTDSILSDLGNFPLWNTDFFKRDSRLIEAYSRHAHILDFDTLRLGKKLVEGNKQANCFEFGVYVITEIGKERGNNLELQEKKKSDAKANQKNDLFNYSLKMCRHSATVDNFPFIKFITDEQRPESWGADARDLLEIVHILDTSEIRLAMPFFNLAELLYGWLFGKFTNWYTQYRYIRGDNTLLMYCLKGIVAVINHYYTGIYSRFGYCVLDIAVENGTQDGNLQRNKYYLMSKKIYSKRFSTDCFSDFFDAKVSASKIGIDDLREYATEKATIDELAEQNSYFINDLIDGLLDEHSKQ